MGVAGSGKTTVGSLVAAQLGVPFADADDFHTPEAVARMAAGLALDDEMRRPWLERLHEVLVAHASTGLVLACSALRRAYREQLTGGLTGVVCVALVAPPDVLRRRLESRVGHYAGPELLASQLATLELGDDVVTVDTTRPVADVVAAVVAALG